MKASLHKTIWFKVISIAVVGTFVLQTNAYARHYNSYDVLPKDDFNDHLIGFGITVALPFVTYGVGQLIGPAATAGTQAGTQTGTQIGTQTGTQIGTQTGTQIGTQTGIQTGVQVGTQGAAQTASTLSGMSQFLLNPSGLQGMQGIAGNMIIYHSAATVGQNLTKAGQLCWGMSPQGSQLLGMVGSSVTMFGMGAAVNPSAISGIYGAQFNTAGEMVKSASWSLASTNPVTAGMLTGAGFGTLTGGITVGVQEALKDSVPPGTAAAIGSLAGTTIGAGLWGGITGPFINPEINNFGQGFANSLWGGTSEGLQQFGKEMALRSINIGITWGAEESGMKPQYASVLGSTGSMLIGNATYALAGNSADRTWWALRKPTEITNSVGINAFLEPAIYGASSYAMAKLTEDVAEQYKATLINMGTFLVASTVASGIHALTTEPIPRWKITQVAEGEKPARWDVFVEDMAVKVYDYGMDTCFAGGAYTGQGLVRRQTAQNDYRGALQLNNMWDFAGIGDVTIRANEVEKQGGDWRGVELISFPWIGMLGRASGMARYHTIRNMELSSYSLIKTIAPLDITQHSSEQIRSMGEQIRKTAEAEHRNPEGWINFVNKMINNSMEPPVYNVMAPGFGTVELAAYSVGLGADGIDAQNKITQAHYYSPGLTKKHYEAYRKDPQGYFKKFPSEPRTMYELYNTRMRPEAQEDWTAGDWIDHSLRVMEMDEKLQAQGKTEYSFIVDGTEYGRSDKPDPLAPIKISSDDSLYGKAVWEAQRYFEKNPNTRGVYDMPIKDTNDVIRVFTPIRANEPLDVWRIPNKRPKTQAATTQPVDNIGSKK